MNGDEMWQDNSKERQARRNLITALLLTLFILLFIIAYSWLAVTRHQLFNSTGYDLAINEQILWNTLNGRFFASSLEVSNSFADHFRPFLLSVLPFYALFPRPETLLILQAVVLASAAIPLYLIACDRLEDSLIALVISIAYLLYPAVGFIARFDFHIEVFAIPAFMAAFLFMERKRWLWASLFLLIPLLVKENMGLTVAMFGLYALIMLRNLRWGVAWIIAGLFTFIITTFWLLPSIRGEMLDAFARYAWLGETPQAMIITLLTEPAAVLSRFTNSVGSRYLGQLLLPVAFIPLIGLPELLLALPGLGANLLADHFCQPTIYCQYAIPVVPFIFIATVYGLYRIKKWQDNDRGFRILALIILTFSLISYWRDNPFTDQTILPPALHQMANETAVHTALSAVPNQLSLVTTNDYAPHLAQREELYLLGIPAQRETPTDPQVVFLNLYDQQYVVCDQIYAYLQQLDPQTYGVTFRSDGLLVLQRDAGDNQQFMDLVENWNDCAG